MLRKLLTGLAAACLISGVAMGANLSLMSGPQDPSQLLASLNTLIRSINFGVSGRLYANTTAVGPGTTVEATLMSYSLPASQLATTGDSVRVVCWGTTASNTNSKVIKLYFGASVVSSANRVDATALNGGKWRLEMVATRSGSATQNVVGYGAVDTTPIRVYTNAGTDALTAAVTVKCTGTAATATQDITAQNMLVEQIK